MLMLGPCPAGLGFTSSVLAPVESLPCPPAGLSPPLWALHEETASRTLCHEQCYAGVPAVSQQVKNLAGIPTVSTAMGLTACIHEDAGLIPGLDQQVKDAALLWLQCRPAAAAPIRPLARELPYAAGAALKRKRKKSATTTKKYKTKTFDSEMLMTAELTAVKKCILCLFLLNVLSQTHCCVSPQAPWLFRPFLPRVSFFRFYTRLLCDDCRKKQTKDKQEFPGGSAG